MLCRVAGFLVNPIDPKKPNPTQALSPKHDKAAASKPKPWSSGSVQLCSCTGTSNRPEGTESMRGLELWVTLLVVAPKYV